MSQALLAGLPLLVACGALALRMPALRAALLGILVALGVVAVPFRDHLSELGSGLVGWAPTLIEVLVILGGGIALSRIMDRSGAQGVLADWVGRLTGGPVPTALLVVHGVTPFAESVTGFGVGVMVGVPLLVAAGFGPHRAAVLGLLGLCAVPWGALGPGTIIAGRLIGASAQEVGVATAWPNLLVFVGVGVAAVLIASPGRPAPVHLGAALLSGLLVGLGVLASNILIGMAPSGALGALLAIVGHVLVRRAQGAPVRMAREVRRALVPYGVLLAGILVSAWTVPLLPVGGAGALLTSPGTWLVVTCLVAVSWTRLAGPERAAVAREVVSMWQGVALPTAAFLALGVVMVLGGLTEPLARALGSTGPFALVLTPVIGALGGCVTGSGAGANSMFAAGTGAVAPGLGVSPVGLVGVQNAAACLLTMASPARVLLAVVSTPRDGVAEADRASLPRVTRSVLVVDLVLVACLAAWNLVVL